MVIYFPVKHRSGTGPESIIRSFCQIRQTPSNFLFWVSGPLYVCYIASSKQHKVGNLSKNRNSPNRPVQVFPHRSVFHLSRLECSQSISSIVEGFSGFPQLSFESPEKRKGFKSGWQRNEDILGNLELVYWVSLEWCSFEHGPMYWVSGGRIQNTIRGP